MRKISVFLWVWCIGLSINVYGQGRSPLKVDKKIPITGNENFDFLYTRSVMLGKNVIGYDDARSGSNSFGFGYGFPLGKSLALKFEPRATWFKTYYQPNNLDSVFPTSDRSTSLISEKQRVSYLEVPVSFKFKLARNLLDHYKVLIEAGFVLGVRTGSSFKTKHFADSSAYNTNVIPKITVKTNHIDDLSRFRYGPFMRFGTNWLSIYGFYRMSDVYRTYRKFTLPAGNSIAYPKFPRLEFGISIAL